MNEDQLNELGAKIVQHVRDRSMQKLDAAFSSRARHAIARRFRAAAKGSVDELVSTVVMECVDGVIAELFHAIDSGALNLRYVADDDQVFSLTEDGQGELAGWYIGQDGWRTKFSKTRFIDDITVGPDEP